MLKINSTEKYFFTFLLSVIPITLISGSLVSNLFLLLISASLFYYSYRYQSWEWIKSKYFKLFLFFYIYLIFNSLLSSNFETSILRSIGYVKFLILPIFVKIMFEEKLVNYNKIFQIWLITLSILSTDILYQGYFGKNIIGYDTNNPLRNSSFFFDELKAAALIVGFAFISFSDELFKKKKIILILFFFLIATLVTGERANFIRYFLIFLIFIYFYFKNNRAIGFKPILITLILMIISFNFFGTKVINRYTETISFKQDKNNLSISEIYLSSQYGAHGITSIYILNDNLFFGAGNKNFRIECRNYTKKISIKFNNELRNIGCGTHPHQTWYELLSEHGLIGTFLILFVFYRLIKIRYEEGSFDIKNKMALIYILNLFIPIIPFGSMFSSYNSAILWINIAIYITQFKKLK